MKQALNSITKNIVTGMILFQSSVIDIGHVLHVCVLSICPMDLTIRVCSGSIPIPCEERDKLNFFNLTKKIVNDIVLEPSREMIHQSWHK